MKSEKYKFSYYEDCSEAILFSYNRKNITIITIMAKTGRVPKLLHFTQWMQLLDPKHPATSIYSHM